jgi:hypothetical protein
MGNRSYTAWSAVLGPIERTPVRATLNDIVFVSARSKEVGILGRRQRHEWRSRTPFFCRTYNRRVTPARSRH